MTANALALAVSEACESEAVDYMLVGAFAVSTYAIPRSTKDVDVLLSLSGHAPVQRVMNALAHLVEFDAQVQFDTLTWGKRMVGVTRENPPLKVELFEMFDDPFVFSEFSRRQKTFSPQLGKAVWLPTPEDVVVQKLRWGRAKDMEDARDVLAVQDTQKLDMAYIEHWCSQHGTQQRLAQVLAEIPPL